MARRKELPLIMTKKSFPAQSSMSTQGECLPLKQSAVRGRKPLGQAGRRLESHLHHMLAGGPQKR